ncbi:conserved Plasmodium protein, unknown function [Plasmodium gallinaceum]|uniref:Uncharacterized protein n=1 Tax=Plasmodium gallinaceum TaxID=5849 RepID=A0A1J1GXL3_PLAGA|nr:conserved Plasmodium protein, unknown function [Plasmodium gallinaceum]CRG97196.1 conserved Plasmodium protein, unknown function [Plasmodium gallinaceum]
MLFMKNYYYFMHNKKINRKHYKKFGFYKNIKNRKPGDKKKKTRILSRSICHNIIEDLLNGLKLKNVNNVKETYDINIDEYLFDTFEKFCTSIFDDIPMWVLCSMFHVLYGCNSTRLNLSGFYYDLLLSNKKYAFDIFFK